MNQPLVYIIILNWNGYKDTIECLESLKKITYRNYKIILIDNGSTDESVKILHAKYPKIKLIGNKVNLGFAGGCNIGIKYALKRNSDYVLLLNNDTIVDRKFLTELVNVSKKDVKIGITTSKIYYADKPNVLWSTGNKIDTRRLFAYISESKNQIDLGQYDIVKEIDCAWGCSILIPNNLFVKIGLFDERYFMYVEDIDLCIRIKESGHKILYAPKSKVWHKISAASGGGWTTAQTYYNTRNYILMAHKLLTTKQKIKFYKYYLPDKLIESIYYIKAKRFNYAIKNILGLINGLLNIN